jgi:hypothetical protein
MDKKDKMLINQNFCSQVVDIYNGDYEKDVYEKNFEFVMEMCESLQNGTKNTKIILIHTDWSVNIYQEHLLLKRPECFDIWYHAGLKLLLENYHDCNYGNIINVEFSKFPVIHPEQKPQINSFTNYTIPKNFDDLCQKLRR